MKSGTVLNSLIISLLILTGCPNPAADSGGGGGGGGPSNNPPTVGSPITVGTITDVSVGLSWGAATDDNTPQASLEYSVYRAASMGELDTVAEAEAATKIMDWTANQLSHTATGLTPSSTYFFAVLVRDSAGAKALYAPVQATTQPDTSPPTVGSSITFSGVSANSITVQWGAATDNATPSAQLQYKVVRTGPNPGDGTSIDTVAEVDAITSGPQLVMDWTANVTSANASGLTPNTNYYFAVVVKDQAGNKAIYSPQSHSTNNTADTTPPMVGSGPTYSNVMNTSVTVNWGAANDDVTPQAALQYKVVRTGPNPGDGSSIDTVAEADAISGSQLVLNWTTNVTSVSATGLTANTTYFFAVLVRDAANNMSIYLPTSVTTANVADTTPPTVGTGITRGTVTDVSAVVNWGAASDNISPTNQLQYKVVRASALADIDTVAEANAISGPGLVMNWTTNVLTATASGLTATTIYAVAVLVRDESGNMSLYAPILIETKPATLYPHSTMVGYNRPPSGEYSAVDLNGDEPGYGWNTQSWPLGVSWDGNHLQIAVFSQHATRILLEFYDREHYWASKRNTTMPNSTHGQGHAVYDIWMEKGSDNIWRAKIANVKARAGDGTKDEAILYAFRAWGPNWPWDSNWSRGNSAAGFVSDVHVDGHRFNPNKILTDPYARELSHDTEYPDLINNNENGGMYGTGGSTSLAWDNTPAPSTYSGPISTSSVTVNRRNVDTGRFAPKGYVIDIPAYSGTKPNIPEKDMIIYEAHVKGISMHPSASHLTTILDDVKNVAGFNDFASVNNVPAAERGTYLAAGKLAKYFKALGINAIEFVPVHETRNDLNHTYQGSGTNPGNYWGYMTYGFFAPDRYYSFNKKPGGPTKEFQQMVQAFANEGIEVWLDVVYNHTGEGGTWGSPDVTGFNSFGGFDTVNTYHLNPFDKRGIVDGATGCGNQVNFSKPNNRQMVLDSLTYWIDHMGVSGFRFDLAAVLGRDVDSHDPNPSNTYWDRVKAFNSNFILLTQIASLGNTKSAKMIAEAWDIWSYPVGQFPSGWGEWNGRYRDATRKFMKGTGFSHDGVTINDAFHGDYNNFNDQGGPHKSINFIVAHDGFTLADLVSYNAKTNSARQWPFGPSDGGSDSNESWDSGGGQNLRRQRIRNFWVWQFFSRGVPMIVWGDEFGRTQKGNNNPYNIDSVATWNNYEFINNDAPQSVPPQGTMTPLSTANWLELTYHNNLGTDTKSDNMNNLFLFARSIIKLRQNEPALRQNNYSMTIEYHKEDGSGPPNWDARARRFTIRGQAVGGSDYVLCVNMWTSTINFTLPTPPSGKVWKRIIDTAHWAESDNTTPIGNYWPDSSAWTYNNLPYGVNAWSIVVFKALNP